MVEGKEKVLVDAASDAPQPGAPDDGNTVVTGQGDSETTELVADGGVA